MTTSIDNFEYFIPDRRQTIEEVSIVSNVPYDELEKNLGYFERYITEKNETFLDLAEQAVLKLMKNSNITPCDINYIIFAYSGIYNTNQIRSPSSKIQNLIKAKNAFCFEINNGCNSLNAAIHIADQILSASQNKSTIMIVASDTLSKFVDYTKSNVAHSYMYSDGAAALLLSNHGNSIKLLSSTLKTDGKYADVSRILYDVKNNTNGQTSFPIMKTVIESKAKKNLFDDLILNYINVISESMYKVNITTKEIHHFFLSRNSKNVYNAVLDYFDIGAEKTFNKGHLFGHVGSIDSIIALSESIKTNTIKTGDYILLSGTGVGFHWGSHLLQVNG